MFCCPWTTLWACSEIAATTFGWQCPVDSVPMPAHANHCSCGTQPDTVRASMDQNMPLRRSQRGMWPDGILSVLKREHRSQTGSKGCAATAHGRAQLEMHMTPLKQRQRSEQERR